MNKLHKYEYTFQDGIETKSLVIEVRRPNVTMNQLAVAKKRFGISKYATQVKQEYFGCS